MKYKKFLTKQEYDRMTTEYSKVKYLCKCGRKVVIPSWVDKQLCDWCGRYVFKSKKDEFEYRMKEKMLRSK